jgi:transcriptional regulator with XRE-family HTH domain
MVTDEQRGRYGRWLRKERLGRGWSVDETRAKLARAGYRIGESSYAEWESGRKRPSRDAIPHLVALFGSEPPEEAALAPQSTDGLAELAAAIREQTDVNRQLVTAVGQLALVMHQDRHEAPDWFVERGDEWTALVLDTIRQTLGVAAGAGLPGSDAPRPVSTPPGPADNEPAGSRGKR